MCDECNTLWFYGPINGALWGILLKSQYKRQVNMIMYKLEFSDTNNVSIKAVKIDYDADDK